VVDVPQVGRTSVQITSDTAAYAAQLRAELARAGRDAGQALDAAVQQAVRTTGARAGRQISRDLQRALRTVQASVRIAPDVRRFRAQLQRALRGLPAVQVRVEPDLSRLDTALRRRVSAIRVPVDADSQTFTRSLSSLASVASRAGGVLAGSLRFAAIGAAALSAAAGIAAFTASLAPTVGILAALPAALTGAAAGAGVLGLALSGVGDAFSAALAGNAEKFQKSLEGLSPAARAAAQEVRALRPAFDQLKASIQGAFFGQLQGEITETAQALGGPLRSQMTAIAAGWGTLAAAALQAVRTQGSISSLQGVMASVSASLNGVAQAIGPVVSGFIQMGGAIANAFGQQASNAITGLITSLGTFLTSAAQSGQAVAWVQAALTAFRQLGALISQIGGLFGDVFGALAAGGGSGVSALTQILGTVRAAIQPLLPLITQLAQTFSTVLGTALSALGPILAPLITALSSSLGPILPQLAAAFGQLFAAIQPVGQLLSGGLGQALQQILPIVSQLAQVLVGVLAPVFAALMPVIQQLLPPVLQLVAAVGQALMPVIQALGPIVAALVPALVQLVLAFSPILNVVVQLAPILTPIVGLIGQLVAWVLRLITPVIQLLAPLIAVVVQFFAISRATGTVIGWLGRLWGAVATAAARVGTSISRIIGFFTNLLGRVTSIVTNLVSRIPSQFTSMLARAASAVSSGISRVVGFFTGLWGRISGPLTSISTRLAGVFRSALSSASGAVKAGLNVVVGFFSGLWGRIKNALGNIKDRIVDAIKPDISLNPSDWFADGGVINGPRIVGIGEAGPEAIIPLTRPDRALQLLRETGLGQLYARRGAATPGPQVTNHWHIQSRASDPMVLAQIMSGHIARAAGV